MSRPGKRLAFLLLPLYLAVFLSCLVACMGPEASCTEGDPCHTIADSFESLRVSGGSGDMGAQGLPCDTAPSPGLPSPSNGEVPAASSGPARPCGCAHPPSHLLRGPPLP